MRVPVSRHTGLVLALPLVLAACGGVRTETVTITRTRPVTTTVERRQTVTAARAEPTIYVPMTGTIEYKPSVIYLSADSGDIYEITHWISYGGETARATADWSTNNCEPNCASGQRETAHLTISFTSRVPCKGVTAYARLNVVKSSDQSILEDGYYVDLTPFCR